MANYFQKIQHLYPDIQHVVYWQTQYDGTPWADPYDGIVWNNKDIPKPDKATLDALSDEEVMTEIKRRTDVGLKTHRNVMAKSNLALVAAYVAQRKDNPAMSFEDFLDSLEAEAAKL